MRLRRFSYCVIQLRNLSSKLIYPGIKTNIDNSIGTCLNFCRYEDKDLYCVVLVGQYGFRSYQGSSNSMQGLLGLNKVKTFCIPDLMFFSKLKKIYILKFLERRVAYLPLSSLCACMKVSRLHYIIYLQLNITHPY